MFEERVLPQRMENSQDNSDYQTWQRGQPSKYRPISLLNIGGKALEQLLINRIMH